MVTTIRQPGDIYYPEEDGKVSESAKHYEQAHDLRDALRRFFSGHADIFIGVNIFLYYRQGDPRKVISPDLLVARGVPLRPIEERGSYRLWEEGVVPQVVVELTSGSTRQEDMVRKPRQYAALGVHEYFMFDPMDEFLKPRLQGYRLNADGHYDRLPGDELESLELGLRLVVRDGWLRLLNPRTNTLLPTDVEVDAALAESEAALAESEAALAARDAALVERDAENARLRAELERLRGNA